MTNEEMGRIILFFNHTSEQWLDLSVARNFSDIEGETQGGMDAYAHRQASMFKQMAELNGAKWRAVRKNAASVLSSREPWDNVDTATLQEQAEEERDEALGDDEDEVVDVWDLGGDGVL